MNNSRRNVVFFLFTCIFLSSYCAENERSDAILHTSSAVTYGFSGGRFGDNLVAYMHAKFISILYDIPLLYKPFFYSDQLVLHEQERLYSEELKDSFSNVVIFGKAKNFVLERDSHTLYIVSYFPESRWELAREPYIFFDVDWKNERFKNVLKQLISPKFSLGKMQLPKDRITVAIHVRRGGSFEEMVPGAPLKFPDASYYIENLKVLDRLFGGRSLYVYIFTDDKNPACLAMQFQKSLQKAYITFDYRKTRNDHNLNVLEDFFALTQFDCLIHPDSNFSVAASKLTDYLVRIEPKSGRHVRNRSLISESTVIINEKLCQERGITINKT